MGICLQRNSDLLIKQDSSINRQSSPIQYYLLNSFSFDPKEQANNGFFFINLPSYSQIQYLLRNKCNQQDGQILRQSIKKHIQQIDQEIYKLHQPVTADSIKQTLQEEHRNKQTNKYKVFYFDNNCQQYCQKLDMSQNQLVRHSNKTLNFQLVGANLNDYDNIQNLSIQIYLDNNKIVSIMGQVFQKRWNPIDINQISIIDCNIKQKNDKKQSKLKIVLHINELIQCTIPLNKMTFKHLLPVLQTCNLRSKSDNQPLGHIHFKIQYIQQYDTHKQKIINHLQTRKDGLIQLYNRIQRKTLTKSQHSLIIMYDDGSQSFASNIISTS